ncbi:hypothetical protein K2Z83_09920 [Oscillochloris sp. ZM17-4]|uniref:DUF2298 domain-containing protein n=1 Tax=Oscillochloris sp. ZM17-4 TaxID=2866714 RepID=UPI001C72E3CD|nr:DUF2298 domain-containing protein [Oscillochloris sp. ZM17-4]MBX0327991.1 hypothetical protein [Oscillochloris sp. ZM17-4]
MKRLPIDIALLLAPALAVLLLWQAAGGARLRPADLAGADRLTGFSVPEDGPAGTFRWGGAHARVSLPAGGLPGVLMLRGAVAPGALVHVALGDSPPVALPAGGESPQLRRYAMILPPAPDALGWAALTITADPPARIDGRNLGMALTDIGVSPIARALRWPPPFVWIMAACLPALLAVALSLAGAPRRPAAALASLIGVGLAWIWATYPTGVYPWLLDLRALLSEPLIWRWWLASQLIGLAAWPLTARVLRGLPLAGYPLAKAFGLLLITWLAWALASVGVAPFALTSVISSALLVAAIAWLSPLLGRQLPPPPVWRGALAYELLFLGGLWIGVWLRWHGAVGPAITGTEKPMDFAILNAVLRYGDFPPLDPWFAGFGLNYYYLGFVIVAVVTLLTGTAPALAFNLGFALVIALTVVGVAYAAHALIALSPSPDGARPRRHTRVGVAMLALFFCLAIGSQASALQMLVGSSLVRALDAGQIASALAQRLAGADTIRLDRPTPPSWDGPPFDTITPETRLSFDWYMPSRSLYDDVALPSGGVERRYAITEFPAFSLYLGDLHPYILVTPFDLLALAVALSLAAWGRSGAGASPPVVPSITYGAIIGCLYCINPWDAPTYALLGMGALLIGQRAHRSRSVWRPYALCLAAMVCTALLSALPFLLTFRSPSGPIAGPLAGLPVLGRLGATLGLVSNHTRLHSFLMIFGLFLIMLLAFLITGRSGGATHPSPQSTAMGRSPERANPRRERSKPPRAVAQWRNRHAERSLYAILLASIPIGVLLGFPLLFLMPLIALLLTRAAVPSVAPGEELVAWAAAVGCIILLVPEVVYIRDLLEGEMSRMNTIFKFYYQAWMLLGIVAAYAVWANLRAHRWRWPTWIWATPTALLIAGALVYPLGLLRWAEPWLPAERTLNGLAWMAREHPDELAAARWMAANVAPQGVVITGFCNCDYEEFSRVAAISGVQTVLGLDGHERLWRSGSAAQLAEIAARARDIPAIYRATDEAAALMLLDHYKVRYLYLGPVERGLYGDSAAAFAHNLPVAFSQGEITIYRVP